MHKILLLLLFWNLCYGSNIAKRDCDTILPYLNTEKSKLQAPHDLLLIVTVPANLPDVTLVLQDNHVVWKKQLDSNKCHYTYTAKINWYDFSVQVVSNKFSTIYPSSINAISENIVINTIFFEINLPKNLPVYFVNGIISNALNIKLISQHIETYLFYNEIHLRISTTMDFPQELTLPIRGYSIANEIFPNITLVNSCDDLTCIQLWDIVIIQDACQFSGYYNFYPTRNCLVEFCAESEQDIFFGFLSETAYLCAQINIKNIASASLNSFKNVHHDTASDKFTIKQNNRIYFGVEIESDYKITLVMLVTLGIKLSDQVNILLFDLNIGRTVQSNSFNLSFYNPANFSLVLDPIIFTAETTAIIMQMVIGIEIELPYSQEFQIIYLDKQIYLTNPKKMASSATRIANILSLIKN